MIATYLVYILLLAASTLAAPATQRDKREDLSSYTGNNTLDTAPPTTPPSDISLPPVAQVFALMAAASQSPPTSSMPASPMPVVHLGPGLESSPTTESTDIPPEPSLPAHTDPLHANKTPLSHKFIFVTVFVLSVIGIILAVYVFSYHRQCRQEQRLKIAQSQTSTLEEKEKDLEGRCCSVSVVDISHNFPRSKFSVTSSDYPISTSSSTSCDSESSSDSFSDESMGRWRDSLNFYPGRRLLNSPFFSALRPSSVTSARRHSRNGSAPALGGSRFGVRKENRKSHSISGRTEERWV
ncbi:hypothetical protein R3P38DRAFT_2880030 [Favolaschia claudopus]|uniref:Uncharacterized protein n=1 Tax=Favolaschia claudopus TaxID=2862362 RepID=A0AAW0D1J2_9AGAR